MEATHGTWGERVRIFQNDSVLVTVLYLKEWQRCSWHWHKTAFNQFYVISGELGIKTSKGYTSHKKPETSFTVEPGIKHEFQTYYEPTVIVEVAFVKYDEHDIEREQLGGSLKETQHE